MYGRTPSPEIMNHFSSLGFVWCLGVDQLNTEVINGILDQSHIFPALVDIIVILKFVCFSTGYTNGRTTYIKKVITSNHDCGQPE